MRDYEQFGAGLFVGLCLGSALMVAINGMSIFPATPTICDANCVDRSGLAVQQSMAVAAWIMIGITVLSVAIGFATVLFLRRNFTEASRAYLDASAAVLSAGQNYVLNFSCTNSGPTPAKGVIVRVYLQVEAIDHQRTKWHGVANGRWETRHVANVPAGGTQVVTIEMPSFPRSDALSDSPLVSARFCLHGKLSYRDVFGRSYKGELFHFDSKVFKAQPPWDGEYKLEGGNEWTVS